MKDRFAGRLADGEIRHKGRRVGTIWAHEGAGTGDVTLTSEFLDTPTIYRADILQDAITCLQREYAQTLGHMQDKSDLA